MYDRPPRKEPAFAFQEREMERIELRISYIGFSFLYQADVVSGM